MNYQETINYLFESAPMFQQVGGAAYKEGLENSLLLDKHLGHPHRRYKTIHVGGTNGKGSVSHLLAATFQLSGYKTGLYTSPHLVDFRERIRVNGVPISEEAVVDFVAKHRDFFEPLHPSFFELTTAMAFDYFAQEMVDVAIIEVGMGGRLDCTNIITPVMSIITNVSMDHMQYLGNTIEEIAREKAGIIKTGVPVVLGDTDPVLVRVVGEKAKEMNANVVTTNLDIDSSEPLNPNRIGLYQLKNIATTICALALLQQDFGISSDIIGKSFEHVHELTGLMGRWQKLSDRPTLVCDGGHNAAAMKCIAEQLELLLEEGRKLHIVLGMSEDKDVEAATACLPDDAEYYFTQASVKRALPAESLQIRVAEWGLQGACYPDVVSAVRAAQEKASPEDFIFVGGSSFVVADLLSHRDALLVSSVSQSE
ncbi:MAG: bifunctional folylpolyglutamate synthase/dihydrofolate synthase [Prevotellaceae bacterium]|jgi:dihydrofolate synthase/folylpolyglutamate synthase|nr:bifunctional folylpolyglutamate synthase/dihydrofolate synthase [Prevotellaceae bacterium]